jgi:hypothetical protein
MRVAIGIAHAAFLPERVESRRALLRVIPVVPGVPVHVSMSTEREHARVWARRLWQWAAEVDAESTILLNDDVSVAPELVDAVIAMTDALPGEIISLHTQLPAARSLAEAGQRWLRSYWCSGPGYVLPRGVARRLVEWLDACPTALAEHWNEDGYCQMLAWSQRRPIWHCIPGLVQHDVSVPSTLGYDNDPLRTTCVPWTDPLFAGLDLRAPEMWRPDGPSTFVENPWMTTQQLVPLEHQYDRGDRFVVVVATPHKGTLHHGHVASVQRLMRTRGLDVGLESALNDPELLWLQEHDDLTRCRSRMLQSAYEAGATHLLFVDSDCSFSPEVVANMLLTGKDFVQAPYRRRDGLGYAIKGTAERRQYVAEHPGAGLRAQDFDAHACVEIDGTGLGLTLLSRACMKRMLEHYRDEPLPKRELDDLQAAQFCTDGGLTHELVRQAYELGRSHGPRLLVTDQRTPGAPERKMVALFQLMIRDGELLGEDISFAQRWKDIGGKVWLYLGPGSPITHHGECAYEGKIEDFGVTRAAQ